MKRNSAKEIAALGMLTAVVVVLQLLGAFIRFGTFSISLVLVPIVIGAVLYGCGAGAWLGFVFGMVVLLSGDAAPFLAVTVPGTMITVLTKGICAGIAAGLVNAAVKRKDETLGAVLAALVCPIVNTGIFLIGCRVFFWETIVEWAGNGNAVVFLFVGLVGLNFVFELAFNILLAPIIVHLLRIIRK